MTKDAQSALRRTMEKEGRSTKFCLICNYVSGIIEPITSRCAKFRFKPLASDILLKRLRMIVEAESVNISEGLEAVITSEGTLRKAIHHLPPVMLEALRVRLRSLNSTSTRSLA